MSWAADSLVILVVKQCPHFFSEEVGTMLIKDHHYILTSLEFVLKFSNRPRPPPLFTGKASASSYNCLLQSKSLSRSHAREAGRCRSFVPLKRLRTLHNVCKRMFGDLAMCNFEISWRSIGTSSIAVVLNLSALGKQVDYLFSRRNRIGIYPSIYLSIHLPVAPTWSIGHPWNASFHLSFLILDSR
jgi:hypothetical protein